MHEPLTSATIILVDGAREVSREERGKGKEDDVPVDVVEEREEVEGELDEALLLVSTERAEDFSCVVLPIVCHKSAMRHVRHVDRDERKRECAVRTTSTSCHNRTRTC